ncbi:hypothetical protein ACIBBD_13875 [Streptomyces sp. NPDC051315]|uniref:hypothetical protein n=1 Tax=Streptomyces sp. NPDC051315 TaxID=3365650 RepID=UPI00379ED982
MTHQPPPPGFGPPPPPYGAPAPPPCGASPSPQYAAPPPPYGAPAASAPEFLAVDRHNSIVVDASGIAFEMYGVSAEFDWPEIRSVHYKASPNGKALMVAVVHLDGRFYEAVVDAKPREKLAGWFGQLAWVLGHYRPMG